MEPDILLKLQQYPDYKEGHTIAMPMCTVCKFCRGRNCLIFGKRLDNPKLENVTKKYEICDKAVLDETAPSYPTYMELYGYRHKDKK